MLCKIADCIITDCTTCNYYYLLKKSTFVQFKNTINFEFRILFFGRLLLRFVPQKQAFVAACGCLPSFLTLHCVSLKLATQIVLALPQQSQIVSFHPPPRRFAPAVDRFAGAPILAVFVAACDCTIYACSEFFNASLRFAKNSALGLFSKNGFSQFFVQILCRLY